MLDSPWSGTRYSPATAVDIASVESAIVIQLQKAIGNVLEIAHYPNNPESYRLTHRIGAALVQYVSADYGRPVETAIVAQERTLEFSVTLIMRDLGWAYGGPASATSPGAYQMLEAVRTALAGFLAVPDVAATKLKPLRERFLKHEAGLWHYIIFFSTRTMSVENFSVPNFPLFITGMALDEAAQTTRTVGPANYLFNNGGTITLPNRNLSGLSVTSLSGQVYVAGIDYSLDATNGIVTRIAAAGIALGATVVIAYNYAEVVEAIAGGSSAPLSPTN